MTLTADRAKAMGYRFIWEPDWSLPHSHAVEYCAEAYPKGEPDQCEGCLLVDFNGTAVASLSCIDDADDAYRAEIENDLAAQITFPVAVRSSVAEARRAFEAGQVVLISDNCLHHPTYTVGPWTTTHDKSRTTWAELDGARKSWGKPQRYYVVPV